MRLMIKAKKDYADPQRSMITSEVERERLESPGRLPKLPELVEKADKGDRDPKLLLTPSMKRQIQTSSVSRRALAHAAKTKAKIEKEGRKVLGKAAPLPSAQAGEFQTKTGQRLYLQPPKEKPKEGMKEPKIHLGTAPGMGKALPKEGVKGGHKTPPKEYREGGATRKKQYADPANYKYPIDTEVHVRAAISYFSKPKNAAVYSPAQQKAIWGRIRAAAKRMGISLGPKSGPPSVEKKMEKAMDQTFEATNFLKANALQADQNYQALLGVLHDAGTRGSQLEGWLGVQNLAKSLERYYGEDAPIIAHVVGWNVFEKGLGAGAMIDSMLKACAPHGGKALPIMLPSGKAEKSSVEKAEGGATGPVSQKAPPGVVTSAGTKPPPVPGPSKETKQALKQIGVGVPGSTPATKQALASIGVGQKKAVAKAIEMLLDMAMSKATAAEMSPANPAREQGPVGGTASGGNAARQQGTVSGFNYPGNPVNRQTSVEGFAHAGKGPAQTSVSGTPHGGSGPAQTSVSGAAYAGNEGQMNKALQAASIAMPRVPVPPPGMDLRTWESATRVLTTGNSVHAQNPNVMKNYATGPLTGEVLQQVMTDSNERARRHIYDATRGPVYKSCGGCGRTYTVRKSVEGEEMGCPTCTVTKSTQCAACGSWMAKSHGGHKACPLCG